VRPNFTHAQNAYLPLLALVHSSQLDLRPIKPKTFALSDLDHAMEAAVKAGSLELVAMTSCTINFPGSTKILRECYASCDIRSDTGHIFAKKSPAKGRLLRGLALAKA
jgi:hypothetical protein